MPDIQSWLADLGLGQYASTFVENDIDEDVLSDLTNNDLKDLGVSLGHRKKLLKVIRALQPNRHAPSEPEQQRSQTAPIALSDGGGAERRQLTVMFCDLVGSTLLAEQHDPEALRDIIARYQDACARVITRFEGFIARYVGDGLLVYFGFPRAHEDDAERAFRAALGILAALGKLDVGDHERVALEVRISIATGLVVVGDIVGEGTARQQAVIGESPNLAARPQNIAGPNQIVIASDTQELLGQQFDCRDLGPQSLKGVSSSVCAFQVLREHTVESRFGAAHAGRLSQFVGRNQEVALLMERWRQARAGEGQLVLLSGEAGQPNKHCGGESMTKLDYISLGLILFAVVTITLGIVKIHTYPGKVATARKHPQTEAIEVTSLLGLLIFPLWMFALVWAYSGAIIGKLYEVEEKEDTPNPAPTPPTDASSMPTGDEQG